MLWHVDLFHHMDFHWYSSSSVECVYAISVQERVEAIRSLSQHHRCYHDPRPPGSQPEAIGCLCCMYHVVGLSWRVHGGSHPGPDGETPREWFVDTAIPSDSTGSRAWIWHLTKIRDRLVIVDINWVSRAFQTVVVRWEHERCQQYWDGMRCGVRLMGFGYIWRWFSWRLN